MSDHTRNAAFHAWQNNDALPLLMCNRPDCKSVMYAKIIEGKTILSCLNRHERSVPRYVMDEYEKEKP